MKVSEVQAVAEDRLREAFGGERIAKVDVKVAVESDDREFLDIVVRFAPGGSLPSGKEWVEANGRVRRQLRDEGETRFASILYMASDEAA